MSRVALITGASAGIGAAFARRLAAEGYRLVLVARDGDRLAAQWATRNRTAGSQPPPVEVVPADLTTEAGQAVVADRLAATGPEPAPIDLLVNSAGLSLNRSILDSTLADQQRLLALNVEAVMRLSLAALPGMVARGSGGVINVSSVAGFTVPRAGSTYSATKAWVTNFSESLALAAGPHGVRVLALCPGLVRTEFHQRAGIDVSRTHRVLWLDADAVAGAGLAALRRGRVVRVVDWRYRMLVAGIRFLPRGLVHAIARGGMAAGRSGRTL